MIYLIVFAPGPYTTHKICETTIYQLIRNWKSKHTVAKIYKIEFDIDSCGKNIDKLIGIIIIIQNLLFPVLYQNVIFQS